MNLDTLTMNAMFQQLGMAYSNGAIREFLKKNAPLPPGITLHEAAIWNQSQADFLLQAKADDAEWSTLVDQLDALLRETQTTDE